MLGLDVITLSLVGSITAFDVITLFLIGSVTAFATGLGAIPVILIRRENTAVRAWMSGLTIGIMSAAAIIGLLKPALDLGSPLDVAVGLALGALFVVVARQVMDLRRTDRGLKAVSIRRSLLVFGVLFVHSIPEGFALGTAFASDIRHLTLFIVLAIGLQNIPEGTSMAIPMKQAGFSATRQFWAAVMTSAPQPFCAVFAFLLVSEIQNLLPISFAFAAGAMLLLVAVELAPNTYTRSSWRYAGLGTGIGVLIILLLSIAIRV